jgi:hypothetical protein
VPAFPSVRITALPRSSVWACSSSPRIIGARAFTVGMVDPKAGLRRRCIASETCASRGRRAANECQWNRINPFPDASSVPRITVDDAGLAGQMIGGFIWHRREKSAPPLTWSVRVSGHRPFNPGSTNSG